MGYESEKFATRHIGPTSADEMQMLQVLGYIDLSAFIQDVVPSNIRIATELSQVLDVPKSEVEVIAELRSVASENEVFRSLIGTGYYGTIVPPVIKRNVLENPAWYTAYTPYQPEISQGRLEALFAFQTMICELTGLSISNASMLDESTAAAEAMTLARRASKLSDDAVFLIEEHVHPQTKAVVLTRAKPLGIKVVEVDSGHVVRDGFDGEFFGALLQYPDTTGTVIDYASFAEYAHSRDALVIAATDLLALTLLKAPGEWGADIAVGTSQRFGVPMGYGGPHAAFFACREEYKRIIPGRIIGVSVDAQGNPALRMALQTREQHIKRDKATSNICTAQALLAIMASMYAVYHGPDGLKRIANKIHSATRHLAERLSSLGYDVKTSSYFDTLRIGLNELCTQELLNKRAIQREINLRYETNGDVCLTIDETTSRADLQHLLDLFAGAAVKEAGAVEPFAIKPFWDSLERKSEILKESVFNSFHSETEMMRYIKRLENKDLALNHSMISLGSCTMKLNAATELMPLSLPEFGNLHPFIPVDQAAGYHQLFDELSSDLCQSTGFAAISLQPNSGAQGEYAGLMTIRAYHISRGDGHRNIALIPSSAHGTNPASAVMAGMDVIVVKCDESGNVDIDDLRGKAIQHRDNLSALMVTYPSTHGVFEEGIRAITDIIHENGGLVYMDGANMNAQVGLTSPGTIGADVCHLNLHKTFAIPHGGGGPGMGPIGVNEKLAPFLPGHGLIKTGGSHAITAVSAAPFGSSLILLVSYAYIKMLGPDGITNATRFAILNANYLKAKLEAHYPVLYKGSEGCVAHEMIIDCREFKKTAHVEVADIAKRLMDYGYHAPTVSFPVPGTIMIEPTESESLAELDRFAEAMISIRNEIAEIETGLADAENNVIVNAPHTATSVISDSWNKPYSREKAAYPLSWVSENKFWPSVGKVDNAYGDRNLVCSCTPIEADA